MKQRINFWLISAIVPGGLVTLSPTIAQVVPDATLSVNSQVTPAGNTNVITGGTQAGNNLFHSFEQFSITTGSQAYFNNALDIQNVISRVTGGSISNIDGLIQVNGAANFFLLNPNGIVFGPNASLNIGGSFVASTANALQFGSLGFFSATDKNAPSPLLTINPSALVFNQINQNAVIQNNSTAPILIKPIDFNVFGLQVPDGKSLLLVGGNINMDGGRLNTNGGRVELGGLGESGSVGLLVDGNNLSLIFPENIARASVSLTNQAGIYVTGVGGGNITVNARNLEILEGTVLSAGIGEGLGTPETIAGDITLNATGEIKVVGESIVRNLVRLGSQGNGGNITIDSGSFSLENGSIINASTFGKGNAGNVTVMAKDAVSLVYAPIFSTVSAGGIGKGGNIDINAATLSLIDGAQLLTFTRQPSASRSAGRGDAGNVNVKVTGAVDIAGGKNGLYSAILSRMETGTVGNGGNITIDSGSFSLRDGAQLSASTFGQGNAGNVTVRAKDAVSLADDATIFSIVEAGGVGKGGNIDINAASLSLIDSSQLLTLTSRASDTQPAGRGNAGNVNVKVTGAVNIGGWNNRITSGILSSVETGTIGNGGNITIDSGSFLLGDGAQLSASTLGQGNAGNVTVRAKDAVSLVGYTFILSTVEAGGVGKGGNIDINAASLSLMDSAQLITITRGASDTQPAGQGDAGNVNVKVTGAVNIAGEKNDFVSGIFSLVGTGTVGNGGNITIDSSSFSLRDGGQLSASTFGQGNAGTIKLNAADFTNISGRSSNFNSGLFVNSQSTTGAAGDINITSPRVTLDNSSTLNAQSAVGNGGNIDLQTQLLILRRGAQISTTAGTIQAGGNGGNININAPLGFIVAVPRENSDIDANAFGGTGGQVSINAQGVFGTQVREQQTPESDITASSDLGPQFRGTVEIITPDVDPSQGLNSLPVEIVDASNQVSAGCTNNSNTTRDRFVSSGRGGLPPSPSEAPSSDAVWIDLGSTTQLVKEGHQSPKQATQVTASNIEQVVEATGWVINAKGQVLLTSLTPTKIDNSLELLKTDCKGS